MTWQTFYDIVDLGDGFGSKKNRTNPHRGLDCPRGGGVDIPSWLPGEVVVNQWSSVLGWVLVIKVRSKLFIGFCHMKEQSPLKIGTQVGQGQTVGRVGNTGSASQGNHVHLTAGTEMTSVFYGDAIDPWPLLQAALDASLAALAGGNKVVIDNTTPQKKRNGSGDMAVQYARNSKTGEIARFAESTVTIFGSTLDYTQHKETMNALIDSDPTGQAQKQFAAGLITRPPELNSKNFVGLDQRHWELELAVRRGNV